MHVRVDDIIWWWPAETQKVAQNVAQNIAKDKGQHINKELEAMDGCNADEQ